MRQSTSRKYDKQKEKSMSIRNTIFSTAEFTLVAVAIALGGCTDVENQKQTFVRNQSNTASSDANEKNGSITLAPQDLSTASGVSGSASLSDLSWVEERDHLKSLWNRDSKSQRILTRGDQTLPVEQQSRRALVIGKSRMHTDSAYQRRGAESKGNPFYFVYDAESGRRVVDLSALKELPEGSFWISPDKTHVLVHYIKSSSTLGFGRKAIREVYSIQTGEKIFSDPRLYDWSDEPQFDASGKNYFHRTRDFNLVMAPVTNIAQKKTIAEDGVLAFRGHKDVPEIILLTENGIELFSPETGSRVQLQSSIAPDDVEAAWFFGNNEFSWRRDRGMLYPFKDQKISYWSAGKNFFAYDSEEQNLKGWDKPSGKLVLHEKNIAELKQDFMNPNVLFYRVEEAKRMVDLNDPKIVQLHGKGEDIKDQDDNDT